MNSELYLAFQFPVLDLTLRCTVIALLDLYSTLNYPPVLKGWRKDGGDPCDGTWTGVFCVGSSVINL